MSQNKRNILLWGFGNDYMRNLQNYLDDDINIKVWVDRKKYPGVTHDMPDFYKALRFSKKPDQLKIEYRHRKEYLGVYEKIMKHTNAFLYMYSRHPILNGENNFLDMMDAFHIYIHFFIDLLKTNRITSIFFSEVPHHADFILYLVAKELGIKVHIFSVSMSSALTPSKSIMTADITQMGTIKTDKPDVVPVKVEKMKRKQYFYTSKKNPNWYIKALSALFLRRDIDLFFHRVMNIKKAKRFTKDYKHALSSFPSQEKFVYFPLHFQPEMTTQSLGGIFVDQILAIEYLRALLPDEWNIIVKENPAQAFHSRGSFFFVRLKKIPGVFYIGKEHDTFKLIEKSEFVSTITGTAGLEALNFGKRVLIFGNATYKEFPGVICYTKNLTFEDIMSVQLSHEELELAHAKLQQNMIDAIVSRSYICQVKNFSREKNARALASQINKKAE